MSDFGLICAKIRAKLPGGVQVSTSQIKSLLLEVLDIQNYPQINIQKS